MVVSHSIKIKMILLFLVNKQKHEFMKLFLLFTLIVPCITFAQMPMKDGNVVYEKIDSVHASKQDIYTMARLWIVNAFHDAKSVIELDDKENG